jgi:hypothetical protein
MFSTTYGRLAPALFVFGPITGPKTLFFIQFLNGPASRLAVRVHVDHGRLDLYMTEYFLDCHNVCSPVDQPCSERVSQIMKAKVLNSCFLDST